VTLWTRIKNVETFIGLHLWFGLGVYQIADDTKIYSSCRPNSSTIVQCFIQPFVSEGVWNCQGDDRVEAWSAERGRGLKRKCPLPRCPPPQGWGSGGVTPGKFETQFGVIWCILARNWRFYSSPHLWTKTLP